MTTDDPPNDRLDFVDARLPRYDRCDQCGAKHPQHALLSVMVEFGVYDLRCKACVMRNPYGPDTSVVGQS